MHYLEEKKAHDCSIWQWFPHAVGGFITQILNLDAVAALKKIHITLGFYISALLGGR